MTALQAKSRKLVFHYLLEDHAKRTPTKPCLMMQDRVLSYADVDLEVNRWARGLSALCVEKGDRVLLMIPSGIEHVLIWLALCRIGALMVPVNDAYKGTMLRHQVNDSGAALAIVWDRHLPVWHELRGSVPDLRTILGTARTPLQPERSETPSRQQRGSAYAYDADAATRPHRQQPRPTRPHKSAIGRQSR